MHHLQARGWNGVWVNAFRGELRTRWFPAPAARQLAAVGASGWAVEIFGRLRAADLPRLSLVMTSDENSSPAAPRGGPRTM